MAKQPQLLDLALDVADADALVVRSATKVTADLIAAEQQGPAPRRYVEVPASQR